MTADEENRSELQMKNIRYQNFKIIAVYYPNKVDMAYIFYY